MGLHPSCISFYCCYKTSWPKATLVGRGLRLVFISAYNYAFWSIAKESGDRNSRQEPGGGNGAEATRGVLLTSFLLVAHSAFFLKASRTTCHGVALPPASWLLHQSSIKNLVGAFSQLMFLLPNYSSLHQVEIKLAGHTVYLF